MCTSIGMLAWESQSGEKRNAIYMSLTDSVLRRGEDRKIGLMIASSPSALLHTFFGFSSAQACSGHGRSGSHCGVTLADLPMEDAMS